MPPGIEGQDSVNVIFTKNSFITINYCHNIHPLKLKYTDLLKHNTAIGEPWEINGNVCIPIQLFLKNYRLHPWPRWWRQQQHTWNYPVLFSVSTSITCLYQWEHSKTLMYTQDKNKWLIKLWATVLHLLWLKDHLHSFFLYQLSFFFFEKAGGSIIDFKE